jgi:hypothetical protein
MPNTSKLIEFEQHDKANQPTEKVNSTLSLSLSDASSSLLIKNKINLSSSTSPSSTDSSCESNNKKKNFGETICKEKASVNSKYNPETEDDEVEDDHEQFSDSDDEIN